MQNVHIIIDIAFTGFDDVHNDANQMADNQSSSCFAIDM
jgi:hypothetical protein